MEKKDLRFRILFFLIFLVAILVTGIYLNISKQKITFQDSEAAATTTQPAVSTAQNVLHLPSGDISLLISDTPDARAQGLSGTISLASTSAMLFVFQTADKYGFWMKDMNYPIDMIWMDENHRIVYVVPNANPDTYPDVFTPPEKSLYVLEANAGFAQKNNLKVGDILDFSETSL